MESYHLKVRFRILATQPTQSSKRKSPKKFFNDAIEYGRTHNLHNINMTLMYTARFIELDGNINEIKHLLKEIKEAEN